MRKQKTYQRIPGERSMTFAAAVNGVGNGMYVPFTLVFFHYVTGLSFPVVGAVLTVTGLAGMAALPLAGAAVDRFGARPVQYVLYTVRALGFLLYPAAHSLPAFAAVAFVTAAADRAFPAAQSALIGEVARGADRDRLQAALRALTNGGSGAGALLATLVIGVAGSGAYTYAAWGNAATCTLAALLLRPLRPVRTEATGPRRKAGYRMVAADRPFLTLTAANFLNALSYSALSVLFPLFIVQWLHGPAALTGTAFTVNTVLCAVAGMFVAGRVRGAGARRTRAAALGGMLFALSFAGLALLGTVRPAQGWLIGTLLVALVVVYTLGELVHSPSAEVLAVSAAPEETRGRYMATYQLSWSLAKSVSPSLFTGLLALDGRVPWLFLIGTSAMAAVMLIRVERRLPAESVVVAGAGRVLRRESVAVAS
ncbi:MFS transporter [Streptomyces sp. NPDC052225]|uniref:MFS transporter n=1 Tax=Streptomyces sp. NPDC052225 TaxID=3154949 RepID=UPI00342A1305